MTHGLPFRPRRSRRASARSSTDSVRRPARGPEVTNDGLATSPAHDRRDVRERRQHHPPLPRRPSPALRLPVRVAAGDAPGRRSRSPRCSRSSTAGRCSRSTPSPQADYRGDHRRGVQGAGADAGCRASSATTSSTSPTTSGARATSSSSRQSGRSRASERRGVLPRDLRRLEGPTSGAAGSGLRRLQPGVVVDAETILADLPSAHFLHVVRNPWSAYADTKKRPVPLPLADYMLCWTTQPVLRAPSPQCHPRALPHRPHRGRDGGSRARPSAASAASSGSRRAERLRRRAGTAVRSSRSTRGGRSRPRHGRPIWRPPSS